MKKNLKKLLSLLTALIILFTMAGIPAMAEGEEVTVDFTSAKNIAYQKVIYPIVSGSWYSSGGGAPSPDNIRGTDGDLTTKLAGKGASGGAGTKFYIDLEKEYYITKVVLYGCTREVKIYEGALTGATEGSKYVLRDAEGNEATALATIPKVTETQTVNGTAITAAEYIPEGTLKTQYLTFDYNDKYEFVIKEVYIEGVEVDFTSEENLAYDKVVYPIVAGSWYSSGGGKPSPTNKRITDGDLTTKYYAQGASGGAGVKFYVDLGDTYNLKTLRIYGCNRNMKIYKGLLTGATEGSSYVLRDADGNIASPLGTAPAGTTQTVNGISIGVTEFDLSGVRDRYITFDYPDKYSFEIKEIYIERATDPTDSLYLGLLTEEEADKITDDLTLPTELENGTTISWKSSSPHIISDTGEVTRQVDDMPVTLTATMVIDGETYYKPFELIVLKDDGNAVAWKDIFNFDFVASERESYVIQHTGGDSGYLTDPEKWEESFLPGGGYTFNNKGGEGVKMDFAESIEEDPLASNFKVGFTIQMPEFSTPRIFGYNRAGKYSFTVFFAADYIGFGPTSSYLDREWYVRNVDYVNKPVTIEVVYQDGYVYPTVNGVPATRDSDGSTYFKLSNPGQIGYVGFGDFSPVNGTIYYDYYIAKKVDPTAECVYETMTDEDPTRITKDIFLPDTLSNGATIEWSSSNSDVISVNGTSGKVTPSYYDEKVTLTACISYEGNTLYKSFDFVVVAADKEELNLILDYNDFNGSAPYYVSEAPAGSTAGVKNNKLTLTRASEGELSTRKYFVTNIPTKPYNVTGEKVVLEQYLTLLGNVDGGTATLYDKDENVIATYGFKSNKAGESLFFVNANGEEVTTRYSRGKEIFVRLEASEDSLNVLVDNQVITATPIALNETPLIASVKYEVGEGSDGFMSIDNLTFMLSGEDRDAMMVKLDHANFTAESLTNQNPDAITSSLTLTRRSRWGSALSYSSGNKDVLSDYGFVSRPSEDTVVPFTVIIQKGEYSMEKEIMLTVKGVDEEKNMATGNLPISSGAIEGSSDKNAIDGLDETAFVTAAPEKFFAISFGKATTFNKVILKEAKNESDEYGVTGFKIEVSNDGNNWTEVETDNPCTTVGDNMQVEFDQVTAKYVRYYVTELSGTQTGLREFVVIFEPSPEEALELDLEKLVVRPTDYVVTGDLTLQAEGEYGSVITWESSHPDIITDDGRLISTPDKTTTVKLTATLTNGGFTRIKEFNRSVKGTSSGIDGGGSSGGGSEKPGGVSGGGSGGGGGSDDDEDPKPVDPTPVDPTPITPSVNTFKDVASDRWSYEYIMELKEAGIVSGDGENFRPTDKVTREEFVKMLVLSLGITPDGSADFSDVSSDAWHHDYIAVAVEKGIVNGISDTEFGIGRSISRQDMAVMTVRALQALQVELQGGEAPVFTDEHEIADYAGDAVKILAAAGILNGADGKFAPTDNLTREQAAKVLCMIRKELTK